MAFELERTRRPCMIDVLTLPPCLLIAGTMQLAMMPPTQRDGELITDLSPHGATLRQAEVVWIRRLPPANKTSLLSDQPEVLSVPNLSRLRQRQGGLIDSCGAARAGRIALMHRIAYDARLFEISSL
jgi:hypothetical protein